MKTTNILRIILLQLSFFSLFLLSSCTDKVKNDETLLAPSPVSHGAASSKLYPLQEGNFWIYDQTLYDSMGNERKHSFVQKVIGKIVFEKDTFYEVSDIAGSFYRSPNDSLTLIADSTGYTTPRFQYNKYSGTLLKIGSIPYSSGISNYYSLYGLVTYNGNLNRPCLLIITEVMPRNAKTPISKAEKYVQPGVGVIAAHFFTLKSDTAAVKEYVLTQKWELKDYYLYP